MPSDRRLAADVAGYSRLMGADEEGTHARLKAHLRELVDPNIKEHRGRTVNNTGDGLLAEFPSVVDAVRCAVEVQRAMVERNAGMPQDSHITFRIGINLGDIITEYGDIHGTGSTLPQCGDQRSFFLQLACRYRSDLPQIRRLKIPQV